MRQQRSRECSVNALDLRSCFVSKLLINSVRCEFAVSYSIYPKRPKQLPNFFRKNVYKQNAFASVTLLRKCFSLKQILIPPMLYLKYDTVEYWKRLELRNASIHLNMEI